jgi:Fe2+ or Zn2+ uptake regulation protein
VKARSELKKELVDAGIRPSVQRLAIYEFVKNNPVHPTADVVYDALRDELGSLSLTTVYNTLKLFVDAGLVLMLNIDETFRCFDGDTSTHAHFRCEECGKVVDFRIKEGFLSMVEGTEGYEINEVQIYLKGVCPQCKKR